MKDWADLDERLKRSVEVVRDTLSPLVSDPGIIAVYSVAMVVTPDGKMGMASIIVADTPECQADLLRALARAPTAEEEATAVIDGGYLPRPPKN
jgi:hypothetical protein